MENQHLDAGFQSNDEEIELTLASKEIRFANYVIDRILSFALMYVIMIVVMYLNPEIIDTISENPNSEKGWDYLFGYSSFLIYYFFCELLLKGRTIGKLITGTRAITTNFEYLSAGDVAKRTLTRIVPFDAFSFIGRYANGWHDKWTDTIVVSNKEFLRYNEKL